MFGLRGNQGFESMSQGFLHAFLTMRQTVNGTSVAHKKKNSPLIRICIEVYVILLVSKSERQAHS